MPVQNRAGHLMYGISLQVCFAHIFRPSIVWGYCVWAKWAIVWVRGGQVWARGQRVILPMKNLICGQCGQCVLMSVNLKMYVILYSYTVGVWLTNAHSPSFAERKKTRGYIAHITPHKSTTPCKMPAHGHGHMATCHAPTSERVMWTLPT